MTTWTDKNGPTGTIAENYERYFVPTIGAPAATGLLAAAALQPGERVLDVACGTGVVTRLAAERVGASGAVVGLDVNPGMLAVARSAPATGAPIEWHEASAEEMPLPDASFDVVLCQMGLQFVPDQAAAVGEMYRVLADGGRLLLNAPGPTPEPFAILDEALVRHVGPETAGFLDKVFSLHDTTAVEHLLADAGFRDIEVDAESQALVLPEPASFLWQYLYSTPLAMAITQLGDEQRGGLERDVVERWQPFVTGGALEFEVRMVTARARR